MTAPSLEDQIACITREISHREWVYKHWVRTGMMSREKADHESACMKAVLGTLMAARLCAPMDR